ncbi:murein transglycosylase A [Massilia sp. W12]|uniref:murein transglycosylase A n=1 Tax=Massilia sp. W12 TaxID=3126507 RepID=UPI0030D2E7DE
MKLNHSLPRTAAFLACIVLAGCQSTKPDVQAKPAPAITPAPAPLANNVKPAPAPNNATVIPADLLKPASFAQLPGWGRDDLREAWPAFLASCQALNKKSEWSEVCAIARQVDAASNSAIRNYFETFFTPHQVNNPDATDVGLVTGYYEPLLRGARKRGGPYQVPLYKAPDDLITVELGSVYPELKNMRLRGRLVGNKLLPYPSRAEIDGANLLAGHELLWVDDAAEAFFLQVQGSGRVTLEGEKKGGKPEVVRVAYADQNGHPYKSIGRWLVDKGELKLEQASMQGIRAWALANPGRAQEMYNANPSYVFFKEEKLPDPKVGPKGALGVPLHAQRSIAVDPTMLPLGAPVYLATTQPNAETPLQRLMMAQDTGGAIRGAVRADFFWGFGAEAADKAGKMKQRGQMWVLLPKQV